jgi:hypothetical protein
MSDYNQALAAMITVAGGIVPERPYQDLRTSAEKALKHWINDIVNDKPGQKRATRNGSSQSPGFQTTAAGRDVPGIRTRL